jgi:hypothetical protein
LAYSRAASSAPVDALRPAGAHSSCSESPACLQLIYV